LFEAWLANRRYLEEFEIVPVVKSADTATRVKVGGVATNWRVDCFLA
jgi:hypothetical protein